MSTTLGDILDAVGLACLLVGALMNLTTAIGLWRMPDLFSRQHAASKPQVLGILLVTTGVALRLRDGLDMGMLLLVVFFQLMTVPVSAHMITRAGFRGYVLPRRDDSEQDQHSQR